MIEERCPKCDVLILTLELVQRRVRAEDGDDEIGFWVTFDEAVDIGYRVEVEPGFVNRGKRHANGLPWYYLPPGHRVDGRPTVRLPAMFTCRCGEEVRIDSANTDVDRTFATADEGGRATQAGRVLEEAAKEDADQNIFDISIGH